MSIKQYAERDAMQLDKAGSYFCRHVSAMTAEGLHSKSDIAAELGYRDMEIARLNEQLEAAQAELKRRDEAGFRKLFTCSACGCDGLDAPPESNCHCCIESAHWVESKLYAAAPAAATENALLPDHKFRECVNGLLDETIAYAGAQQLRARLSSRLSNFVKPQHAAGVK